MVFAVCAGLGSAVGPVSLGHGTPIDVRILGFHPRAASEWSAARTVANSLAWKTSCRGPVDPDTVHPDPQSNGMTAHMDRLYAAQSDEATIRRKVVQEPDEKVRAPQR